MRIILLWLQCKESNTHRSLPAVRACGGRISIVQRHGDRKADENLQFVTAYECCAYIRVLWPKGLSRGNTRDNPRIYWRLCILARRNRGSLLPR